MYLLTGRRFMKQTVTLFTMILLLSACGTMPRDRAVSGAGLGAAAGAAIGAATGFGAGEGAAVGAAGGALTGVLTDSEDVNFGKPAWKRGNDSGNGGTANNTVARIQYELSKRGFYTGSIDGVAGSKTRSAIRDYQRENDLVVDGEPTPALLAYMQER